MTIKVVIKSTFSYNLVTPVFFTLFEQETFIYDIKNCPKEIHYIITLICWFLSFGLLWTVDIHNKKIMCITTSVNSITNINVFHDFSFTLELVLYTSPTRWIFRLMLITDLKIIQTMKNVVAVDHKLYIKINSQKIRWI